MYCAEIYYLILILVDVDALGAVLALMSFRGALPPYIILLCQVLEALSLEMSEAQSQAIGSILMHVRPYARPFADLFKPQIPASNPPKSTVDAETARQWLRECNISGSDQDRLILFLSGYPHEEDNINNRKSVKSL